MQGNRTLRKDPLRILLPAFLVVIVLALAGFAYLIHRGLAHLQDMAGEGMQELREISLRDSAEALRELGEAMIRQRGDDVAAQAELYLTMHPQMTVADLQRDERFQTIGVQPVGKTGYTALTDYDTLTCRFHKKPSTVNLDLHQLSEKLPGFWKVMQATQGGQASGGYYDWQEPDGSFREKYMWIAIVPGRTADNVGFSVAATTYIDEFSEPVEQLEQRMTRSMDGAVLELERSSAGTRRATLAVVFGILVATGLIFGWMVLLVARFRRLVERRTAELRSSEERGMTILDSMQTGIVIVDPETHRIIDVNPVAARMIGDPKEEIIGRVCHKYICPSEVGQCPITDLGQEIDNSEHVLLKADGTEVSVLKTVVPVTLAGRKCLLDCFVDISELKRSEQALQESLADLEQFNRLAVGRELRMIELKKEINALRQRLSEPTTYRTDFDETDGEKT